MRGVENDSYLVMRMTSMTQLKCDWTIFGPKVCRDPSTWLLQHDLNVQCTRSCAAKESEITRNRGRLSFCREQLRHANAATATALEHLETWELWDMVDILHYSSILNDEDVWIIYSGTLNCTHLVPIYRCITLLYPISGAFLAWVASTTKHQWQDQSIRPSLSWWHPPVDATWNAHEINRPKTGFVLRSESPSKPPQTSKSQKECLTGCLWESFRPVKLLILVRFQDFTVSSSYHASRTPTNKRPAMVATAARSRLKANKSPWITEKGQIKGENLDTVDG